MTGRIAAFFDLDKTVIATSSALVYGKEFLQSGLISTGEAWQLSLIKASYMLAGHSDSQMEATREKLTQMVRGWSVEEVEQIVAEAMHTAVIPTVYEEARDLINSHKEAGHDVVIVSASARSLVAPIAQELGVDTVIATEMGIEDGTYTGEILFYCKGEAKSQAIADLAEEKGFDLSASYAYSDSATDEPMLVAVGHPVAVNPDRALRKIAMNRHWDIRTFRNPVPLVHLPSTKNLSIGTGVLAGAAAVVWMMKRYSA